MQERSLEHSGNEIAIIGMACRFPGAKDIEAFWSNLCVGAESIQRLSEDQLEHSEFDLSCDPKHPHYVRAASMIEDIDRFDAAFFGYGAKDAALIDPQQRLFLEQTFVALQSAGYDSTRYEHPIGIFAGARMNTYVYNILSNRAAAGELTPFELAVFDDYSCLSTRVAYKLNLRGPAYSVQTACSTGLSAIHLACQSVLIGESRMAIAGGVAINVPQATGYLYREGGIASPDGHCRAFDESAAGTVLGNGVGVVVLKRLEDALNDRDPIHAVVLGSAANNDGANKASYTAPSVDGQAAVILDALAIAGIDPETVTYIEAHGTATRLGDPIELSALRRAYRTRGQEVPCAIGSVKSNIGHLESAAGLAGFIKAVLALRHGRIPASLHVTRPIPDLLPFHVCTELTEWNTSGPRRAGVSAFGTGGTNIHMILEEPPARVAPMASQTQVKAPPAEPGAPGTPELLLISAKTTTALQRATTELSEYLAAHGELELRDAAHTLQVGRGQFDHRRMAVCRSRQHAIDLLRDQPADELISGQAAHRSVCFMLAGQGAQYAGVAAGLYRELRAFRDVVDACSEELAPHLGFDLRQLFSRDLARSPDVNEIRLSQPLLFVVEYALAQVLIDCGVKPVKLIGHSLGEYVAACLAGVFSRKDALRLVTARARAMQELPRGEMLSVALSENELLAELPFELDIAAVNAADLCSVSGPSSAIAAFARSLQARGVPYRKLRSSHACHSRCMDRLVEPFERVVSEFSLRAPEIPVVSNLTGKLITDDEARSPRYWAQHLRHAVRFADGLSAILEDPSAALVDVGPSRVLSRLALRHPARAGRPVVGLIRHEEEALTDLEVLLSGLGQLWVSGVSVDWGRLYQDEPRWRVALPTHPFERQRYWIGPGSSGFVAASSAESGERERRVISDWFYTPSWQETPPGRNDVQARSRSWLVFAGRGEPVSERVISELMRQNQRVVVVHPGEHYCYLEDGHYALHPSAREDYLSLMAELNTLGEQPDILLHLWALALEHQPTARLEAFDAAQPQTVESLLCFVQAFAERNQSRPLEVVVVTPDAYEVSGAEKLRPELATAIGAARVISLEYPQVQCRNVDVSSSNEAVTPAEIARHLLAEASSNSEELIVALRGRHRWVQRFARVEVERKATLREGGVYLITGALSTVGHAFAEHLAKTASARLILLEADALPPRESWDQWLSSYGPENEVSARIARLRSLEHCGAELFFSCEDFSDGEALRTAVSRAVACFGRIHGVIHAEAPGEGSLIPLRNAAAVEKTLSRKVRGLLNLCEVLQDSELDFFVLSSSIHTLFGEIGQVDACAADQFLDHFAEARGTVGGAPLTSIDWDVWQMDAPLLGRALKKTAVPDSLAERLGQELLNGLSAEEAVEALFRILGNPPGPRIIVSACDLAPRVEALSRLRRELASARSGTSLVKQQYGRPELQTEYVAPRDEDERAIARIWQDVLGIEPVGVHDNFFELGGHSLLITMMAGRMREVLGLEIPMEKLFARPTIAGVLRTKAELYAADPAAAEVLKLLDEFSEQEASRELEQRVASAAAESGKRKR